MKKTVIVFGASTSNKSINQQFATYCGSLLKETDVKILDLNDFKMPIYDVDDEAELGSPEKANELSALFDDAAGFIVSFAEHNGSYTAAFKNNYDWLSRLNKSVWRDRPVLLLSTSPGGRGGQTVLAAAKTSFPHMGAKITGRFSLPSFYDNYDAASGLKNEEQLVAVKGLVAQFEEAVKG